MMEVFGSFNEMATAMGQDVQGTMSVFNAAEGRFEGGKFMPTDIRRRLDEAFNDLNRGFGWASSLIGGYREGCPELEKAWLRLHELAKETNKVGVGLMPFG
jgi:hypothetical protein